MQLPAEAGAVLVDLRRNTSRAPRWVGVAVFAVLALAVAGDPHTWPLLALFCLAVGGTQGLLWLAGIRQRRIRAVCEHGLVVRRAGGFGFVPWASVRGLREQWMYAGPGQSLPKYIVDTDDKPAEFEMAWSREPLGELLRRAIPLVEERARVKLQRMPRKPPSKKHKAS